MAKRQLALFLAAFLLAGANVCTAQVQRIAAMDIAGASAELKHAVEDKGYRVILDNGWAADFWFASQLKTANKDIPGALYPELANAEFIGVVSLPKGMIDFRGQAIPPGAYTLRYQLLPQDGNHMGVSPNPDFLLAIPIASDPNPEQSYLYKKLVGLSTKSTGMNHPAVIAMESPGDPATLAKEAATVVFSVAIPSPRGSVRVGIILKGAAAQ